ncbi:UDP-glucose 4-epimerase [Ammoniphilus oxalaticus]|uniref:UDP-glucose 4-epimerase n=1 Tax=Ammoniphilus oxalaticus TaxID=66863 RepID=A0A419SNH5_9BACL|nr:NAD-dependent epimerase/dehydratase family protein [Ammoniphilus oxalaticus]RKD25769.1 UDP-glucose 4-epimerase [Ammoniphilus oxalaticus]
MKKVIVTGCAGFIGSALSDRLLRDGYHVTGIDCFTDNYDPKMKLKNLEPLFEREQFEFIGKRISEVDWESLFTPDTILFHQAAMPGVRASWGQRFDRYLNENILATQRLLEAAKQRSIAKFVYASSSSVYGVTTGRTSEQLLPQPHSPYGVTKLSGEQLCGLYAANYGVPTVALRYFTVYGPGQRPDMAFHRFIRAMLRDEAIPVFGDGSQSRDFTYVDDIVEANLLAAKSVCHGEVFNIGGKSRIAINDVISLLERLLGVKAKIEWLPAQAGDPPHTWADITKAEQMLGYNPQIPLEFGLQQQICYLRDFYNV